GTKIIASETTILAAGPSIESRRIGRVRVKGRSEPIGIFEPLGEAGDFGRLGEESCRAFSDAMGLFDSASFEKAKAIFENLSFGSGDPTSGIYAQVCERYMREPPDNFDGVITFTTK
ncbi:MAG TPA: hypothetical protein PLZ86_05315, partial [bacterium]|nr:hypothetical protein [bacterium]